MYIQNSSSFLYSAPEDKSFGLQNRARPSDTSVKVGLENFSEKAILTFESLSSALSPQEKTEITVTLNTIGKAAAFSSMNGFESQDERMLVSQYFENFGGVLSDEAIKKMIFSKLDNPHFKNRDFLERFATALDEPLQGINIRV